MLLNDVYSLISVYVLLFMTVVFIICWIIELELFSKEQSYGVS